MHRVLNQASGLLQVAEQAPPLREIGKNSSLQKVGDAPQQSEPWQLITQPAHPGGQLIEPGVVVVLQGRGRPADQR